MNKIKTLLGGLALSVSLTGAALAAGVEVNASSTGLALQGYDPVAYFTEGAPTKGSYKITSVYEDTTYRFSSEANKATFEADPEAYLPKYGGYCAFGTAMGVKVDGDPTIWRIVDDELYLNLSSDIQERWVGDIPGYVEKADTKWTEIEDKDPAVLLQ
ncbi:YHS domain-containing (seleno)protein [Thalassovita aquimarina]|uniref:YHS domain-containing protein n=1 Tax=Thalassovita aquimarina TaxID=2785917 RepID=A0ABS5HPC6_9RHOB|nr:YHS domain-containing (seleno)protein [Thalassovita aquimarina]MBR9650768.1 YHS domain-containing protein [Thalassovita aquimarina]